MLPCNPVSCLCSSTLLHVNCKVKLRIELGHEGEQGEDDAGGGLPPHHHHPLPPPHPAPPSHPSPSHIQWVISSPLLSLRYDSMQLSLPITRLHFSHFHPDDELADFKLQFVSVLSEINEGGMSLKSLGGNQFGREWSSCSWAVWVRAAPTPPASSTALTGSWLTHSWSGKDAAPRRRTAIKLKQTSGCGAKWHEVTDGLGTTDLKLASKRPHTDPAIQLKRILCLQ